MSIEFNTLVNLKVGTIITITGKNPFDGAHVGALNQWNEGDEGIHILGLKKDEALKIGVQECRFEIAPFFKPACFIRSFGGRLLQLSITTFDENKNPTIFTQTDETPDLPPTTGKLFSAGKAA